jgi:Fe-S-cluster containining protein
MSSNPDSHPCSICRGACCESLLFPTPREAVSDSKDFLLARGRLIADGAFIEIETRCPKLTDQGSCGIYSSRPTACRTYEVGSDLCLATVKARRPWEVGQRILEAIDKLVK